MLLIYTGPSRRRHVPACAVVAERGVPVEIPDAVAVRLLVKPSWVPADPDAPLPDPSGSSGPVHVGGGVYELPNGERVRGLREAAARLAELTAGDSAGITLEERTWDPDVDGDGPLPEVPDSAYPPDATPIEPLGDDEPADLDTTDDAGDAGQEESQP